MINVGRFILLISMFVISGIFVTLFLLIGAVLFDSNSISDFLVQNISDLITTYIIICIGISFYLGAAIAITITFYLSERTNKVSSVFINSLFIGSTEDINKIKYYFCFFKQKN